MSNPPPVRRVCPTPTRTGRTCQNSPVRGQLCCPAHGGRTPDLPADEIAALERQLAAEAWPGLLALGDRIAARVATTPYSVLRDAADRLAGEDGSR